MFSRPNSKDDACLIADFLEYECLKTGSSVSAMSYRSLLSVSDDELDNEGIESSDDNSVDVLDSAISECHNRALKCPDKYPFDTGRGSLDLKPGLTWHKEVYTFLLLTTRLDMNKNRIQAGYDGTKLFEELCAVIVKEYYGSHAIARVFGTSESGSFKDKVQNLLDSLHIKGQYKKTFGTTGREKDGSLDIVAWIPFADNKDGQMIAMGQCKTGTNWAGMLTELDPYVFFSDHSTIQPYTKPQKLFFVAESFGDYKWEDRSRKGGIIFDRTRIMEFLPDTMDDTLLDKIINWNKEVIDSGLNMEE